MRIMQIMRNTHWDGSQVCAIPVGIEINVVQFLWGKNMQKDKQGDHV